MSPNEIKGGYAIDLLESLENQLLMLEDIQSLMFNQLKEEVNTLELQACECLKGVSHSEYHYEVKKWLDN